MGAGIAGPPNVYPAGFDFDYSVWSPGTRVDLVNVNWDNNYRDVVKFANKATLNAFIDGKTSAGITVNNLTYAKPGEDIYLGIPYNRVNRYNYLRASNPLMPIPDDIQKDFYYFILECEFVNPTTTRIRVQLDVWQTYVYDVTFGNCYVERGHVAVANSNKFNNYGRDYLTVPEGLDVGGEYRHIARRSNALIRNNIISTDDSIDGDIIVVSTLDIESSGGTATNPVLITATGSQINGMPSGADFYIFTSAASFTTFMAALADKPWVSQGIVSVTYMPSVSRYSLPSGAPIDGEKVIQLVTVPRSSSVFSNWRNSAEINNHIPSRYQHVKDKFFTYPYMIIEMTAWSGNAIVLKPESWNSGDATVQERASYMPPNQRVSIHPRGYNSNIDANGGSAGGTQDNLWDLSDAQVAALPDSWEGYIRDVGDDTSDYLDMALSISNFPTMPVVNNMAIGYLAANSNQLAFQFNSADWTQQRALGMAQGSYDVATGAMHTAMNASGIGVNADIAQTANQNRTLAAQAINQSTNALVTGLGTALTPAGAGGAAIAGVSSSVTGLVGAGIQTAANDESLGIRNTQAAQSVVNENKQSQLVRDTNKNLADWAARGDYGNQIAGINAKIQDAAMIQPSVSGQFGGESHNIGTNKLEFSFRWKLIDAASIRTVGEIWLRYGYMVRSFIQMPASLMVMSKFTYWKISETYLSGASVPEGHKQVLRGIMEKGVTLWANPDEIGQIDIADNVPLGGISY
jgi:hypothetical protein